MLGYTNLDSEKGFVFFQKFLREQGILKELEEMGIEEGDTVLIYNEFVKTLRPASLTSRLMPGVLAMPHGAQVDLDEETGIDKAGADNVLCGPICSGIGTSG